MIQDGETFVKSTLGNIAIETDAVKASKSTDLVIEAIVENLGIKQKLFKELDNAASKYVVNRHTYT